MMDVLLEFQIRLLKKHFPNLSKEERTFLLEVEGEFGTCYNVENLRPKIAAQRNIPYEQCEGFLILGVRPKSPLSAHEQINVVAQESRAKLSEALEDRDGAERERKQSKRELKREQAAYERFKASEAEDEDGNPYAVLCKEAMTSLVRFAGCDEENDWSKFADILLNEHKRIRALVDDNASLWERLESADDGNETALAPPLQKTPEQAAPAPSAEMGKLEERVGRLCERRAWKQDTLVIELWNLRQWTKERVKEIKKKADGFRRETEKLQADITRYRNENEKLRARAAAKQIYAAYRLLLKDALPLLRKIAAADRGQSREWYQEIGREVRELLHDRKILSWRFFLVNPSPDDPYYGEGFPDSESVRVSFLARDVRWPGLYFTEEPRFPKPNVFAPGAHERARRAR